MGEMGGFGGPWGHGGGGWLQGDHLVERTHFLSRLSTAKGYIHTYLVRISWKKNKMMKIIISTQGDVGDGRADAGEHLVRRGRWGRNACS